VNIISDFVRQLSAEASFGVMAPFRVVSSPWWSFHVVSHHAC